MSVLPPKADIGQLTLPMATSSSAMVQLKLVDKHLASTIHCVDDEIIGWLKRREQRRRERQGSPGGQLGAEGGVYSLKQYFKSLQCFGRKRRQEFGVFPEENSCGQAVIIAINF
jgi:hypothetical protein